MNFEFREQLLNLRDKILEEISKHKDDRIKVVGDRVKVWDGSANIDKETGQCRAGIDPLFENNDAIIIEVDCNIKISAFTSYTRICDVLLKFPKGEEVYCASSMVKRIDKHSK